MEITEHFITLKVIGAKLNKESDYTKNKLPKNNLITVQQTMNNKN